jgi:hypothetical protein
MNSRVLLLINRVLDDAGEAMRTPSGVNVDLLRGYGRQGHGLPHYYGNEIPTRR